MKWWSQQFNRLVQRCGMRQNGAFVADDDHGGKDASGLEGVADGGSCATLRVVWTSVPWKRISMRRRPNIMLMTVAHEQPVGAEVA